jgi:hypothetical protein
MQNKSGLKIWNLRFQKCYSYTNLRSAFVNLPQKYYFAFYYFGGIDIYVAFVIIS